VVVGYPLLGRVTVKPILVEGSVYVGHRSPERFSINMDVRHGNSGGPVVDRFGNVVGVVVAKVNTPAVFTQTGQDVREVGIAIRPQIALAFMRENGVTPVLGAAGEELDNTALFERANRFVAQIGCWR
jgi:S1-C subfamily serine protease